MEKIRFALMFIFLVLNVSPDVQAEEGIQHFEFSGSNYTFHVNRSTNWKDSRRACQKTGGDLVSIESLKEWTYLENITQAMEITEYFIGLKKYCASGEWRWLSDNSKVNDSLWAKDEPSGDGNCAIMYKDYRNDDGEFNDLNCITELRSGYICEGPAKSKCNNKGDTRKCKCVIYSFHHEHLTWNSSREWCRKEGGDLVSIETEKEWNYLTGFIQNLAGSNHTAYYIGVYKGKTGKWQWLSNNKQAPDCGWRLKIKTSGDSAGDCAAMLKYFEEQRGYFIDVSCLCPNSNNLSCSSHGKDKINKGFICEKTVDCNCSNERFLDNHVSTTLSPVSGDGAVSSSSQKELQAKDSLVFIFAIAFGSLDAVLLIVSVILCRGILRRQLTERPTRATVVKRAKN